MNSFYSILQVPIRPAGQEQINIGLLFINEQESYFKYSTRKLDFIKKLIPENSFNLLRSYLFGINENIRAKQDGLKTRFGKTDFINYLSSYNSNLITFTKPTPIELELTESTFQNLFEKFIFTFEEEILNEAIAQPYSLKKQLKDNLYPRIKQRVNIDQTLTAKEIPSLLVPSIKVNFIGYNHTPVAGQGIDFEKSPEQITNGISRMISLIKAFEMDSKPRGKYFIVGKEPVKANRDQHDNWAHIKNSGLIEFVDLDETEKISDYIFTHDVKPFVSA